MLLNRRIKRIKTVKSSLGLWKLRAKKLDDEVIRQQMRAQLKIFITKRVLQKLDEQRLSWFDHPSKGGEADRGRGTNRTTTGWGEHKHVP